LSTSMHMTHSMKLVTILLLMVSFSSHTWPMRAVWILQLHLSLEKRKTYITPFVDHWTTWKFYIEKRVKCKEHSNLHRVSMQLKLYCRVSVWKGGLLWIRTIFRVDTLHSTKCVQCFRCTCVLGLVPSYRENVWNACRRLLVRTTITGLSI
jgi:hypothetical protein